MTEFEIACLYGLGFGFGSIFWLLALWILLKR